MAYLKQWYYSTYSYREREVHTFPKGISPKLNINPRLEFELTTISQWNISATMPQGLQQKLGFKGTFPKMKSIVNL